MRCRSTARCTSRSPTVPVRGDRRPGRRHRGGDRRPGAGRSRWTAWSAATSASARPRWRCAPPSSRSAPASRSRCWCRPRCWPSSTTADFRDRFADWPVQGRGAVALPDRQGNQGGARTARATARSTSSIGTHKLLQGDVRFKDLGLVIVDEEQRFGVRQKEALKALRAEVDLLTLTATPIPRTLNMAMAGLRDLSIIATPPQRRLSVKTFVAAMDDAASLREAFQRELPRGGQVYFLHNEVDTIEQHAPSAGASWCPRRASRIAPRPDARARARAGDARLPPAALQRAGVHDDHRVGHRHPERQHHHHQPRRPLRPGPAAPAARPRRPLAPPRLRLPGGAGQEGDDRATRGSAWKRSSRWRNSAPASPGHARPGDPRRRRAARRGAVGARSHEVGFTLYTEMLERAVRSIRAGKMPDLDSSRSPRRRRSSCTCRR